MPVHDGFIQDIVDHPLDESIRLIYADWLDEHNDPFAEVMRQSVSPGVLTCRCYKDVRERGTTVYVVDARVSTWVMEGWTQFVAHVSRQRVDWLPFHSWSGASKLLKAFGLIDEVVDVVKWLLPVLRAWHNHDCRGFHDLMIADDQPIGRFEFGVKWDTVELKAKKLTALIRVPDEMLNVTLTPEQVIGGDATSD